MHTEVGPVTAVDDGLRAQLLACWTDVSNAGGSVGFVPPVTEAGIAPYLDAVVERVHQGREVIAVLRVDGEVSTFLADVVEPGDRLEVRGPIGGWFVWDGERPALLVGGGTGVVPLVAMLRTARALGRTDLLRIAVSTRTLAELPYADELLEAGALVVTTREAHGVRRAGRLTAADLVPLWEPGQTAYVCGSAGFAEAASQLLVEFGVPASDVRVERFGPSG